MFFYSIRKEQPKSSVVVANKEAVDLDRLAQAVAVAETSNCTEGYALTHNNCHGIKKGSIVPCKTKKGSRMCNFATKTDSFEAFKTIWNSPRGYKGRFPTREMADAWTGKDSAATWLNNVKTSYYAS